MWHFKNIKCIRRRVGSTSMKESSAGFAFWRTLAERMGDDGGTSRNAPCTKSRSSPVNYHQQSGRKLKSLLALWNHTTSCYTWGVQLPRKMPRYIFKDSERAADIVHVEARPRRSKFQAVGTTWHHMALGIFWLGFGANLDPYLVLVWPMLVGRHMHCLLGFSWIERWRTSRVWQDPRGIGHAGVTCECHTRFWLILH